MKRKLLLSSIWVTCTLLLPACTNENKSFKVYPQPQVQQLEATTFTTKLPFQLKGKQTVDADVMRLLTETLPISTEDKALPLTIAPITSEQATGTPELLRSGAYQLHISKKGIDIYTVDDRSLFYALQTLKQLVEKNDNQSLSLPIGTIKDYPEVAYRGTVEGFYGTPWAHDDRLRQLQFYGNLKLNTYIYGPKDDPYHSSPHWRDAYPTADANRLKELIEAANRNKVDFVWAIHPGKDIQWNKADSVALLNKFDAMYQLGVRSFAVFFDDISGVGTDPMKQASLLNYIHTDFIAQKPDVKPLIMCPTEYNKSWSNPKPNTYLDILGKELHPSIHIMWTGNRVVDDITLEGLAWVNKRIQRPAFVWWNFPVSDYVRDHLLMGASYGLDTAAAHAMSGFVSNPMERAEPSKVAIFSVADYAWNTDQYNPDQSWKDAMTELMPGASDAFFRFCTHNSDPGPNGHLYRRVESVALKPTVTAFIDGYKTGTFNENAAQVLLAEFKNIEQTEQILLKSDPDNFLLLSISDWLKQFTNLGKAGQVAIQMSKAQQSKQADEAKELHTALKGILQEMEHLDATCNQNPYQPGVKTGSLVLMPMIQQLYAETAVQLYGADAVLSTQANKLYTNIAQIAFQPVKQYNNKLSCVRLLEVIKVPANGYLGHHWSKDIAAKSIEFNLPQASWAWAVVEWSADGETWSEVAHQLTEVKGTISSIDPTARYIRIRNKSDKEQMCKLVSLAVTL